ncbi:MAG TPA: hypothetical protein VIC24_10160 [Gemmatimonadaceae bacterium]|jgi:hypothetical protein
MPGGDQQAPWTSGSKTNAVQHAFVNARIVEINRRAISKLLTPTLDALKATEPSLRKASRQQLEDAFMKMTARLQSAPLTINLEAPRWFMTPNNYDTYTQMYERAVTGGQMQLADSALNPASFRVAADDAATFPKSAVDADFKMQGLGGQWQKYDIKAQQSQQPGRGLAPQGRGFGDAVLKMAPGALSKTAAGTYTATNPQFDPKTKQIFAALNYGRRPHGSTTRYGHSFLVLNDKFKRDALYFGGDTFGNIAGNAHVSAEDQISYDALAAVFLKAVPSMRTDLLSSCLRGAQLTDTDKEALLLEAHLFEPLAFRGGATTLCISAKDDVPQAAGGKAKITGADWVAIQTNARTFASKHGLKLLFIE